MSGTADRAIRPQTEAEALDAVREALARRAPVEIVGHGSKRGVGRPLQTASAIDLTELRGVTLYEPEELVLTARAGTPLAEIEATLAASGQELAFDPPDCRGLLGAPARGRGTVGAALAANLSGPRRLKAGAARDHALGIRAATGRGDLVKSGGRVVKNVTGYDLPRGLSGSWGTLALFTEVTFKVLPRAVAEATLVVGGLDDAGAAEAMAAAMGSNAEVSAAAHLPEDVAGGFIDGRLPAGPVTLLRLEGIGPSVDSRFAGLGRAFAGRGPCRRLDGDESRALWREARDAAPFADGSDRPVWRISLAPSAGHRLVAGVRRQTACDAFYDWQGGLVWLRLPDGDPQAGLVRGVVRGLGGGHATLMRASPAARARTPAFEPQEPALAALCERLRRQFDPERILNPGRMGP